MTPASTSPAARSRSAARARARRRDALDICLFALLAAGLVWLLLLGTERTGYYWQWYRLPRFLFTMDEAGMHPGPLLAGLWVTLRVTALSFVLAFAFGLLAALCRLSGSPVAALLARVYLETIRNTPLLIQIFFMYFVLSPILGMESFASAVLALSLFEGAYASEIFRAGIESVDKGQWEAARSLGGGSWFTYVHVVLPQAVRRIIPPLLGQGVSLIKDSALVSTIAVYDLTMQGMSIVSDTFLTFEVWFTVAGVYLALNLTLAGVVRLVSAATNNADATT
ncbi:MAG: amino acid ABC transporter permease [Desulfovibrionaceae bacterium]